MPPVAPAAQVRQDVRSGAALRFQSGGVTHQGRFYPWAAGIVQGLVNENLVAFERRDSATRAVRLTVEIAEMAADRPAQAVDLLVASGVEAHQANYADVVALNQSLCRMVGGGVAPRTSARVARALRLVASWLSSEGLAASSGELIGITDAGVAGKGALVADGPSGRSGLVIGMNVEPTWPQIANAACLASASAVFAGSRPVAACERVFILNVGAAQVRAHEVHAAPDFVAWLASLSGILEAGTRFGAVIGGGA